MTRDKTANDQLERFFRRLVTNLAALDASAVHRPIPIADIHERLVPYRTHRTTLGFDSGEDYEMTVLRLLAGEGGYALLFPENLREAMAREVASTNPDTSFFKNFPDATVVLEPEKIEGPRPGGRGPGDSSLADTPEAHPEPLPAHDTRPPAAEEDESLPFTLDDDEPETEGNEGIAPMARPRDAGSVSAPCSYCGCNLPVGRTVLFCPHCGQNVGVVHCPTCGSELDVGWQFCITCGQKVTGIG